MGLLLILLMPKSTQRCGAVGQKAVVMEAKPLGLEGALRAIGLNLLFTEEETKA